MTHDHYENPLSGRYASREMNELWSSRRKFSTWRRLWLYLAEAEAELGLPITAAQLAELRAHLDDIDFAAADRYEEKLRHDVMAHIHAYGDLCPAARPIIHLGATSCYVTDNADLLLMRRGLELVRDRLVATIDRLATFAQKHRKLACLGFTHWQPAQPTTVGKRAALWAYDLVMDLGDVESRIAGLKSRGVKGTTGTQASFLELFQGDHRKVVRLDRLIAEKMGFKDVYPVTGQTYSRKVDAQVIDALAGIAASAHKAALDLRMLQSRKELEEPFEAEQVGSSAMPYKRNPMRAERMCGLARYVMSLQADTSANLAVQGLERTLDDSANRRIVLPQAFLATDAFLRLYQSIAAGLVVYPQVIAKNLYEELPFMASEQLLMAAVAAGGDRQDVHERLRRHSHAAAAAVKQGGQNDLLDRLAADPAFAKIDLQTALEPDAFVGRAPEQVDEFIADIVTSIRKRYPDACKGDVEIRV